MPSDSETAPVDVPPDVQTAARRYWRRILVVRGLLAFGYFVVSVALLFALPFFPALALIAVVIGTLAAPVFKSSGTIELTTHRDADAVHDEFGAPMPPVLGFQAALADEIRLTETGVEYDFSTLFGLRSTTMRVETERFADDPDSADPDDAGIDDNNADAADLEVVVTVGDEPWGRYQVTTAECDGDTTVTITTVPDRRFGVRRLPDFVFGRRYRRELFEGQEYTLVADDTSLSV